jgi:type IV pilus assembly protein PilM
MEFLPTTLGTRPRLAVEVRAEGVVAARAEDATAALTAVAKANLVEGALAPGLKVGNIVDKAAVVAAVRKALDGVAGTGRERSRDVTLVVPDSAVRVLFVDFDQLPSKPVEALPVVRFRLKKLLPFDVDDAMVSYQVMSNVKGSTIKMVAVAMPKDVLAEYEAVVLAAGYLPGAVLPSTLAALAGLEESESAALVVNAGPGSVTTAIVQAGILMLHRSVDMRSDMGGDMGAALLVANPDVPVSVAAAPAMSVLERQASAQGWAQQEAGGTGGWDRFDAATGMQSAFVETAEIRERAAAVTTHEVTQAVSVAAAYFEDTLRIAAETLLSAGTLDEETLSAMMDEGGLTGLRVREIVDAGMLEAGASTATVPRCWLAGVRGALRN